MYEHIRNVKRFVPLYQLGVNLLKNFLTFIPDLFIDISVYAPGNLKLK